MFSISNRMRVRFLASSRVGVARVSCVIDERRVSPVVRGGVVSELGLAVVSALTVLTAVGSVSVLTGAAYHLLVYDHRGPLSLFAAVGALVGLLFTLPFVYRNEYRQEAYQPFAARARRIFGAWNYAFVGLAVVGFLTKTTAIYSRGWLIVLYLVGLGVVLAIELAISRLHCLLRRRGVVQQRRLIIVGTRGLIADLDRQLARRGGGQAIGYVEIVARIELPDTAEREARGGEDGLATSLGRATAAARRLGAESVLLLVPLEERTVIEAAAEAFSELPVAVHMSLGSLLGRFEGKQVARVGSLSVLTVTDQPMTPVGAFYKRSFDILVAGAALVLLSPLLAVVAILIKLDSRGPVFFRQHRHGYNRSEFLIWKFRTMHVMEDGDDFVQVRPGDARVTRIGRHLRRLNIDELPQLLNVLAGDMSIVGPRPHAVAHDRQFESRITAYPKRLNVRPGITGWAQVNGFRGVTDTEEKMTRRVEHDLFYVDNWSLLFDIYIMVLTVVSPRAFRNAL